MPTNALPAAAYALLMPAFSLLAFPIFLYSFLNQVFNQSSNSLIWKLFILFSIKLSTNQAIRWYENYLKSRIICSTLVCQLQHLPGRPQQLPARPQATWPALQSFFILFSIKLLTSQASRWYENSLQSRIICSTIILVVWNNRATMLCQLQHLPGRPQQLPARPQATWPGLQAWASQNHLEDKVLAKMDSGYKDTKLMLQRYEIHVDEIHITKIRNPYHKDTNFILQRYEILVI